MNPKLNTYVMGLKLLRNSGRTEAAMFPTRAVWANPAGEVAVIEALAALEDSQNEPFSQPLV